MEYGRAAAADDVVGPQVGRRGRRQRMPATRDQLHIVSRLVDVYRCDDATGRRGPSTAPDSRARPLTGHPETHQLRRRQHETLAGSRVQERVGCFGVLPPPLRPLLRRGRTDGRTAGLGVGQDVIEVPVGIVKSTHPPDGGVESDGERVVHRHRCAFPPGVVDFRQEKQPHQAGSANQRRARKRQAEISACCPPVGTAVLLSSTEIDTRRGLARSATGRVTVSTPLT